MLPVDSIFKASILLCPKFACCWIGAECSLIRSSLPKPNRLHIKLLHQHRLDFEERFEQHFG